MADMKAHKEPPSTSSHKYKGTFLCKTEFDPSGHYEVTYHLFSGQTIAGIPIRVFPHYMDQQTSRLWKRPLNPIERLVDPLKDILLNVEQMYGLLAKSYRIPGYFIEKTYLQHTLWHNQLLWIDLCKRLTRYARDKLGPLATAKDLIDTWDHPSTAWSAYFDDLFEDALGYRKIDGMEAWEFEENMLDLIATSKMLMVDINEWVNDWVNLDEPLYEDSFDLMMDLDDAARDLEPLFGPI